ncbi:MAG: cytochrome c-type biogenesis protein, partial [Candidatus Entotheonellia bacterium]
LCLLPLVLYAAESNLDEDVRAIAAQLRCPVCQNLSVGDSPSELAREMRTVIREQLEQGKTPAQVYDYFVARYGEWVLLAPPKRGLNLIIWLLPVVLIPAGLVMAYLGARRWVHRGAAVIPSPAANPQYAARLQRELDTHE